jgi:hypothetical protein
MGSAPGFGRCADSVARLAELDPDAAAASHGAAVRQPAEQLRQYEAKLATLERLYLRGYDVEGGAAAYQDKVSTPTVVSNVWQVTPSLFKFKRPNFFGNFALILAQRPRVGRRLRPPGRTFLDTALEGMREHFGLKAIDAIIVTHMHGDHFLEAPASAREMGRADLGARQHGRQDGAPGMVRLRRADPGLRQVRTRMARP